MIFVGQPIAVKSKGNLIIVSTKITEIIISDMLIDMIILFEDC